MSASFSFPCVCLLGWWLVCKGQSVGWVPYSYLEKVDGREDEPAAKIPVGKGEILPSFYGIIQAFVYCQRLRDT